MGFRDSARIPVFVSQGVGQEQEYPGRLMFITGHGAGGHNTDNAQNASAFAAGP